MKASPARLRQDVQMILSKFQMVKEMDGTSNDATEAGDGRVEIADTYSSRGHARFDDNGRVQSFDYSEWDPYDTYAYPDADYSEDPEDSRIVNSYSIDKHEESGQLYFFSERSGTDYEGESVSRWGNRIAVDPETMEVSGTFDISQRPHKFVPLEE